MKQSTRRTLVALGLVALLGGGAWTTAAVLAQAAPTAGRQNRSGKERHPILQNSIRQVEGVKDRLQKAPWDFGGHKVAAIDALNRALNELHAAIQADRQ